VVISGGKVDVRLDFDWAREGKGAYSGNATANALSDEIMFAMQFKIEKGFIL
jgi:hypothetical protein